jgi:hypothetical protein
MFIPLSGAPLSGWNITLINKILNGGISDFPNHKTKQILRVFAE